MFAEPVFLLSGAEIVIHHYQFFAEYLLSTEDSNYIDHLEML